MNRLSAAGLLGCFAVVGFMAVDAQTSIEGWTFSTNPNGTISMEVENPNVMVAISNQQKRVRIDLDKQDEPTGGSVRFQNGFNEDFAKDGATYYWESCNGRDALWSYLSSMGKVTDFTSQKSSLPQSCYGKKTRVTANNGKIFFGRLRAISGAPDVVQLDNDGTSGGPLNIDKNLIKQIQQMR